MEQMLQHKNLGDRIPEGAKKKKLEDKNPKKGNSSHALISIKFSLNAWIVDLGASHQMASTKEVYCSLDTCKSPLILMGDDSPMLCGYNIFSLSWAFNFTGRLSSSVTTKAL
jgi:hypothetical protein